MPRKKKGLQPDTINTVFQKWVKIYIDLLELNNWEIFFDNSIIEGSERAMFMGSPQGNIANYGVNVNTPDLETKKDVERVALHEVLHQKFSRFAHLARNRFVTRQQLEDEEHALIQFFVYLIEKHIKSKLGVKYVKKNKSNRTRAKKNRSN